MLTLHSVKTLAGLVLDGASIGMVYQLGNRKLSNWGPVCR